MRRAALDTLRPGLGYFRAFAHGPPPPLFWYIRKDWRPALRTLDGSGESAFLNAGWRLRLATLRNRQAAMLALIRGDKAQAVMHARENITATWYLNQSAWSNAFLDWITLAEVGHRTGDSALVRQAQRLHELDEQDEDAYQRVLPHLDLLFADVEQPPGLEWIGDGQLPPKLRWEMMSFILTGYCLNAREILFGVDPRRRALVDSAARLAMDVNRIELAQQLVKDDIDAWIADPSAAARGAAPSARMNGVRGVARAVGLGSAGARLAACMHWNSLARF